MDSLNSGMTLIGGLKLDGVKLVGANSLEGNARPTKILNNGDTAQHLLNADNTRQINHPGNLTPSTVTVSSVEFPPSYTVQPFSSVTPVSIDQPAVKATLIDQPPALYEPIPTQERSRLSTQLDSPLGNEASRTLDRFNDPTRWASNTISLGMLMDTELSSYSQHAERSIASTAYELGDLDIDARSTGDVTQQAELKLRLTTRDGDQVDFSFSLESGRAAIKTGEQYSYQEVIIDFNVEGELSKEEREAIADFSKQLSNFAQGFFINPDNGPDLSALKLFDDDLLASIDLSLKGQDASLSLSVAETDESRSINVEWVTNESKWASGELAGRAKNTLQLLVDKHGTTEGGNIQQDLALTQQQAIIDESLDEARATGQQKSHISDAFAAIQQDLSFFPPMGKADMVTGLADYDLSFQGSVELPMQSTDVLENPVDNTARDLRNNENSRLSEGIDKFNLSQDTSVNTVAGKTLIRQQQDLELKAAYFTPLAHLEEPDFMHQSFIHNSINNTSSIVSEQRFDGPELVSATIVQQQEKSHVRAEYNEGELISRTPTESSKSSIIEATELLMKDKNPAGQDTKLNLQLLDELFFSSAFES